MVQDLSPYFQVMGARTEISDLLPNEIERVLEVGCGTGKTLGWIKEQFAGAETVGIELHPEAVDAARKIADRVVVCDIEKDYPDLEAGSFDVILCLDVLEHLVDPWTALDKVVTFLKPGGRLIASIPNVRNLRVVLPLVFLGRWRYQLVGLLDRTHLRFFTRRSALELVEGAGLEIEKVLYTGLGRGATHGRAAVFARISAILNFVTLGLLKDIFVIQYLILGIKRIPGQRRP